MACDKCKSERVLRVSGKCSDMFSASGPGVDYNGYVPETIGIAGADDFGDYIHFQYCLDCGKIQGKFPIAESKLKGMKS